MLLNYDIVGIDSASVCKPKKEESSRSIELNLANYDLRKCLEEVYVEEGFIPPWDTDTIKSTVDKIMSGIEARGWNIESRK